MRLVVARCTVDYAGRLTAHLPAATRLLMVKADGCVEVHADGGAYKPLNWMNAPNTLTEDVDGDGRAVWIVRSPKGETLTRTVTRDVELGGQQLRRGDHLMLSWLSANRDDTVFDRPDEVILDREANPHLAFGVGPHRCIGLHMARTMFQVLLGEVLTRIPDYRVDREATRFYATNPELNGIVTLPATFTPGPRVGPAERPF